MKKYTSEKHNKESLKRSLGDLATLITIVTGASGLAILILQLQQRLQMQRSIILLFIGLIFIISAIISGYEAYNIEKGKKMRNFLIIFAISLGVIGLAECTAYLNLPPRSSENQLLNIFENRNLNGSIVLAFYDKNKGENNLVKSSIGELKVVIFKKLNNESVEIIYKPEIDPSGITIISELPEGEYCIGISFFGIILDYVENVNVDYNRFEFVELILKNPQGIIRFEALDSSNFPLSNIYFEIRSNTEEPFRRWKTGKDGKTIDFWIYSLTEKSIGSYYAVAEIEDANEFRHEVWRSKPLRPFFKHEGDRNETIHAIINLKNQ